MTLPAWVDLSREVTDVADRDVKPEDFVRESRAHLAAIGVFEAPAVEAIAHCATECAWGRRAIGNNRGGVKLKEADDNAHRAKHDGVGLAWWRYAGHVEAGDAPVVLYRAFDSAAEFWRFWAKRYAPMSAAHGARYAAAGAAFWGPDPSRWIVELILAGYRGEVREGELRAIVEAGGDVETHPSVASHRSVARRVRAMLGAR